MALAIDASSPAVVSGIGTTSTTASFNPPASVLVAVCGANDNGTAPTTSVTNNGTALTWTKFVKEDRNSVGGNPGGVYIFYATLSAARTGMTVTFNNSTNGCGIKVFVVTGANMANPAGGSASGASTSTNFTTTAFSSQGASSLAFAGAINGQTNGPTPGLADATASFSESSIFTVAGYKTLGAVGSSVHFNVTDSGTPHINWVTGEIVAAPTSAPIITSVNQAVKRASYY